MHLLAPWVFAFSAAVSSDIDLYFEFKNSSITFVPFIGSCIREECHMKTSNSIAYWLLYIPSYLYVHPTKLRRRKMLDCLPNTCYPQEDFYSLTFVLPFVFFSLAQKESFSLHPNTLCQAHPYFHLSSMPSTSTFTHGIFALHFGSKTL